MRFFQVIRIGLLAAAAVAPLWARGAQFLSPNDFIVAVDTDLANAQSSYPELESPYNAVDQIVGSKYLNFGGRNSGFIVAPVVGASTVRSMRFITAGDAEWRDPREWALYGANDASQEFDNGPGNLSNWTLIASGNANLPDDRYAPGDLYTFANSTPYNAYRVVFPHLKDDRYEMQIDEVELYSNANGTGAILQWFETPLAFLLPRSESHSPRYERVQNLLDGGGPVTTIPSSSAYFPGEGPDAAIDNDVHTKYLNYGGAYAGFIITPQIGASQVQSFRLSTANDAPDRDPTSWILYGTNDMIMSTDNSYGTAENWTQISSGSVTLPAARNALGPVVSVSNANAYASYKLEFPTTKGSEFVQISEAAFFSSNNGTGVNLLNPGDATIAFETKYGNDTKYLNFGNLNSGFIVTPVAGAKALKEFRLTTANDAPHRDPAAYALYGTNDAIVDGEDSFGTGENWTLISTGALSLPMARNVASDLVSVANMTAYSSYKFLVTAVRNGASNESPQYAGVEFFDTSSASADLDGNHFVDGADLLLIQRTNLSLLPLWTTQFGSAVAVGNVGAVPEPATLIVSIFGVCSLTGRRHRHGRGKAAIFS